MSAEFTELGSVAEFINGAAFKPEDWGEEGNRIIRIQNLTDPTKPYNRTKREIPNRLQVQPGDLLVSWSATLGVFEWSGPDVALLNQHIFRVLPDEQCVDKRYLRHGLELALLEMQRHLHGATMQHVNRGEFLSTKIYLPSVEEQRRIAAILDAAEALREKRRQSLAKLDSLSQSIFLDIFGDPVANPKEWEKKPVGEIGRVITGNTPPREKPEYYGNEIEWVNSDNLNTPQAYITKAQEMLSKEGKLISRAVPAGSILVTCIAGSPSCIGNAAITDREVAFNQQINALVPKQADFRFLFAHIVVGKRLIQEASTAGMKGMVSKSRFEKIRLMYPPLNLQRTFAAAFDKIEDLKTAQRSSLEKLDELFRSLQHRAFRGEL